jgi:flagellar basal-body rod modification protein FlgD
MALPDTMSNRVTQNSASQSSSSGDVSDQKDLFMKLLVAQLKNQDPLDPQDSSAFVAQLAQFNSLDQLTQIRDLLEQMLSGAGSNKNSSSNTNVSGTENQTTGEGLVEGINKGKSIVNNILEIL